MFYPTLHVAVEKEDVQDVILHVNNGADINEKNSMNKTPLEVAVQLENAEIVELLIESKANFDLPLQWSVLRCAVNAGNFDIVKLLLNAGAKVYYKKENILVDVAYGNDVDTMKLLISGSSKEIMKNSNLLSHALLAACRAGNIDMVKILVEAGAPLIPENKKCETGLHAAAEKNHVEIVELLLSVNLDVDITAENSNVTPLYKAAYANKGDSHFEVIEKLLTYGASLNSQSEKVGWTVKWIIGKANLNMLKLLLKFGLDLNLANSWGKIPLFEAIRCQKIGFVKYLVDHNSDVSYVNPKDGTAALHYMNPWSKGDLEKTKYLLKSGAKINVVDFAGDTPLKRILTYCAYESKVFNESLMFFLKYSDVNTVNSRGEDILFEVKTIGRPWKIILKHLAVLQALGLPVHSNLLKTISENSEFSYFFDKCSKELVLAKETKACKSWITYFDLLVNNKRVLANYAGNKDLVEHIEKFDFIKKFYIYGSSMRQKMAKGVKRRELFDRSAILLSNYLPIFSPTHLVIRDTLVCLATKDLSKIERAEL